MKKLTLGALAIVTSMAATSAALAQDVAAGKTSFNKCMACHAVGEGAKNKVGPELNGIDGRKSGTAEGYSYSDANKNSGITWNKEQFLEYMRTVKADLRNRMMKEKKLSDPIVADLKSALSEFKSTYRPPTPAAAPKAVAVGAGA